MPRPPGRRVDDQLRLTVIAIGEKTKYWQPLIDAFPPMANCCLDVRSAFSREWDEDITGSGFDPATRDRIKSKKS